MVATMPLMRWSHFHISPQPMRVSLMPLESTRRTWLGWVGRGGRG